MNRRVVAFILGRILLVEALLMIPSVAVGLLYRESAVKAFIIPIVLLTVIGIFAGFFKKPQNTAIYAREGFFIVAAAWVLMAVFGAMPFYFSGFFNTVWDCFFEIVSGFTTTGASILHFPEKLPHCILFWRSFSHWVGGMGVLVFVLAIMPLSEEHSLHLMRAEVPGPVVGKLLPRMRDTAKVLYAVYTGMTLILIILLLLGKMPLFDSICNAFGAAGTGGFSLNSNGIAVYNSGYVDVVLSVFMLLFGVNFNLYYLILIGRVREAFKSEELRWYLIFVGVSTVAISVNIVHMCNNYTMSLRQAFFQVSSIITTTGYATADFAAWPQFSQTVLLLLMVVGACAGSTGGGLKVSRVILMFKAAVQELRRLLHPRAMTSVQFEHKSVDSSMLRNLLVYFVFYAMIIASSTLILSFDDLDFTTNFSAELACFNNIGPGIGLVGPMTNYDKYSSFAKFVLSINMLLGRLEIFPMLVIFAPGSWRRNIRPAKKSRIVRA